MFWGGIRCGRKSQLKSMMGDADAPRGGVTARVSIDVPADQLPALIDRTATFVRDNAKIHTARHVREWLEAMSIGVLKWPAAATHVATLAPTTPQAVAYLEEQCGGRLHEEGSGQYK